MPFLTLPHCCLGSSVCKRLRKSGEASHPKLICGRSWEMLVSRALLAGTHPSELSCLEGRMNSLQVASRNNFHHLPGPPKQVPTAHGSVLACQLSASPHFSLSRHPVSHPLTTFLGEPQKQGSSPKGILGEGRSCYP